MSTTRIAGAAPALLAGDAAAPVRITPARRADRDLRPYAPRARSWPQDAPKGLQLHQTSSSRKRARLAPATAPVSTHGTAARIAARPTKPRPRRAPGRTRADRDRPLLAGDARRGFSARAEGVLARVIHGS